MYIWPVLLPAQTNREDFLKTVSLFDDDTGAAIDVSGRTLAAPGDFTAANWVVTCGAIVTASVSQLTIKDYPFGNEMQAIALTVAPALNILAGGNVTIADALTGLNTMTGYVTSYAPATGKMVCQIGSAFLFEIRDCPSDRWFDGGFGASSQIGSDSGASAIIQASLGNMISVVDLGRAQIRIPASTMQQLRHKTYAACMSMFDGSDTRQLFVGKQPILSGGVATMPLASPSSNIYGLP